MAGGGGRFGRDHHNTSGSLQDGGVTGRPHRRLTITAIVAAQSSQALASGGIALFLPLIRHELHLGFARAGTLAAASSLVYALMQVPSGYLADRFTPRRVFLVGLLATNVLSLSFALLRSYPLLVVNQAASGMFRALMFAPGLLLISGQFPPGRRATAMGLYVAGGFSSNVLLSTLGPVLVGPLGWRWLFVIFSAVGLAVLAAYRYLSRPVRPGAGPVTGTAGPAAPAAPAARLTDLPGLLRHRVVWTTAIIQFVRLSVVQGLAFWLPTYLVSDRGYPLAVAGFVVALGSLVTAPANYLGGLVADRSGRPLAVIGVSLGMLAATLSALTFAPGLAGVLIVIAVNAVFVQFYFGPLFAVPIQHLGGRSAGLLSGFGNFCANLGGFAFSYTLGALREATGSFRPGFLSLATMCLIALAATVSLRRLPPPVVAATPVPTRAAAETAAPAT